MHAIYQFVSGPLVWASFTVFVVGSLYRLVTMIAISRRKDAQVLEYMSFYYGLRSILHWSVPFMSVNMRRRPVMTVVAFAFHVCLLAAPVFLLAHLVMLDTAFGISWPALPEGAADAMTLVVVAACVFFLVRRILAREVRFVTRTSDYVLLGIAAAPFVTGFLAYHQLLDYRLMLVLHILTGEAMLVAIPFTRLSHMIFAPFTRAYIGSEFGAVRHARDW
ncbi:Nitrate reductase gamma subunit [Desulfovibrio sp. X2]|uniref:TmcC family electron transfer complex membrane anchor subunit n=1 Tax=Desulfovibrio sp. X2 TaxID=941449 RepID=UPI00035873E4|nr:nitrate reductase subunit gamma [Desulfovibrio sp. X2]EPR43504.1 Nitrate reductase gamma subunit [Desulfovibrio sp. X2]